jgi:anti-sigma regulatory factor (Ser/Thr protein kinase)
VIEITPGAPLGSFPYGGCPEHELTLATNEILMLYTDGLVERRGAALSDTIDELLDVVRDARSAEDVCEVAIAGMVPEDGASDDLAILAVSTTPIPAELHVELAADPTVLARVRRILRRWLRDRGADDALIAEVTLAVNEACANAIEHAYSPAPANFALSAVMRGDEVIVTVHDTGRWRTPRGEDRGRGLTIIETAMDDVDVDATSTGTAIVMRRRIDRP